ncbi:MAG: ion channel [Pseudomonadota bacterium]|nr:ion channel [Pseudomonadota bacterium]
MQQLWNQSKRFVESRFFVLLISILLILIVGPYLKENAVTNWLVGLTSVCVIGGVIYSVKEKTRYLRLFIILALITLLLSFMDIFTENPSLHIASMSVFILFLLVSVIDLNYEIFNEVKITRDILYGSICGYFLIIILFGSLYLLLESVAPGSFHHSVNWESAEFTHHQMYYYSTITITTLGYGDIVPVSVLAKSIAMIECITGVFYIAILVARLIGLQQHAQDTRSNQDK